MRLKTFIGRSGIEIENVPTAANDNIAKRITMEIANTASISKLYNLIRYR